MNTTYHSYTDEELNSEASSIIHEAWRQTNFLVKIYIFDPNAAVTDESILAFNNKLDALKYFHKFITSINEDFPNKNYFLKLREIDHLINLIKITKSDCDINIDTISFDFDDLSLTVSNSGYWTDSVKPILEQLLKDIDEYLEILNGDDATEYYENIDNPKFSLEQLKANCLYLLTFDNIFDPIFIDRFNKICESINDFWSFWFE